MNKPDCQEYNSGGGKKKKKKTLILLLFHMFYLQTVTFEDTGPEQYQKQTQKTRVICMQLLNRLLLKSPKQYSGGGSQCLACV